VNRCLNNCELRKSFCDGRKHDPLVVATSTRADSRIQGIEQDRASGAAALAVPMPFS
jgi:hypothetical protein